MASFGRLRLVREYIAWLFKSKGRHGVHSPFVYGLLKDVIYSKTSDPQLDSIEHIRNFLLKSERLVEIEDFGAGTPGKQQRKLKSIARRAAKSKKYCRLLYRLSAHFKPKLIIELGASLGISSMYLASGQKATAGKTVTIEGAEILADIARKNFARAGIDNIQALHGTFDDLLPMILSQEKPDMVFFDGNHRKAPTLLYFEQCLEKAGNDSVFIFDDINWSAEMQEAWQEIKAHPRVTVTLDLFFLGIVFFRREQEKEDFVIRF